MIRIGLNGLAKFMTASPANQRKVLRDYKYPKEEVAAQALYYKEARDLIYSKHKNKHPAQWLLDRASDVRKLSLATGGQSGRRLSNSARAVEEYAQRFPDRSFEVLPDIDVSLKVEGVRIKINPDLKVYEGGKDKIVKLESSKDDLDGQLVKVICQMMFEGAAANGKPSPRRTFCTSTFREGKVYTGARQGARMKAEIVATMFLQAASPSCEGLI